MSPLLRNTTIGLGVAAMVVAIYFTSIIGTNCQGAILNHLASLVQGPSTRTCGRSTEASDALKTALGAVIGALSATSNTRIKAKGIQMRTRTGRVKGTESLEICTRHDTQ